MCDNVSAVLTSNNIGFVLKTKYLSVIINSSMKTSSDVVRQTRTFYAQINMLLRSFRYCTNDVKCTLFKSFCANMYCCSLWFNSTSSTIKKLKTSYNSALRNLLLIKKPYSASTMFVAHGIPSFYKLLRTSNYRFADRVSKNSNSILMACMTPIVYNSLFHLAMIKSVLY